MLAITLSAIGGLVGGVVLTIAAVGWFEVGNAPPFDDVFESEESYEPESEIEPQKAASDKMRRAHDSADYYA